MKALRLVLLVSLSALSAAIWTPPGQAAPGRPASAWNLVQAAAGADLVPVVRQSIHNDLSPPLKELPPAPPVGEGEKEIPDDHLPRNIGGPGNGPDPVLQPGSDPNNMPGTAQNFEGNAIGDNGLLLGAPPDTNGDVGPNHYVQWVNTVFSVWDKTGNRLYGPVPGNTLWTGFGGLCETTNDGDPIAQYDQLADRWMLSQFAFPRDIVTGLPAPPFHQCIAVSQTPDPTGAYYRYDFEISLTKLNDYPHFGVWPDAYYMSINQFDATSGYEFAGAGAVAFERDKILQGQPARMVYFDQSQQDIGFGGQLPSDVDGTSPPPAGSPNYFVEADDKETWSGSSPIGADRLAIFAFHVDWSNPQSSSFVGPVSVPTAEFDSNLCNFDRSCIPQKDTADGLDAISDRIMYRLAYRNFGDHESLVLNHTVDVGDAPDHAGIRWYEVRDPGGNPSIHQQGSYAPDPAHRWMGSIAMDGSGNMALGYSVSSATSYPAIAYTGRLAGDPLGTLPQGEAVLFAGTGSQTDTEGRWGDYSMMAVDSADDCTFWFTSEYYTTTTDFGWHTRIGSFRYPSCGDLALTMTDSPDPVVARTDLTYRATVTGGASGATGVKVADPLPSGVAFVSATPSVGTCSGTGTVTCDLGSLAAGATATVEIVVRPGAAGTYTNTATVTSSSPDPNPGNNSATVVTRAEDPCGAPGITVLTDPTGDEFDGQPAHDIQRISIAEPFFGDGVNKLVFTLKMASLASVPPDTTWPVTFVYGKDGAGNDVIWYVAMKTNPASQVSFEYGKGRTSSNRIGSLDPETGFSADGTITLVISNSKLSNSPLPPPPPGAGSVLSGFLTRIRVEAGPGGAVTPDNAPGDVNPAGSYTLFGNAACKQADLSVTKSDSPDPVHVGEDLTYKVTVHNAGPGSAAGVSLVDALPSSVSLVSLSPPGACSGTRTLTCSLGTIAVGSDSTVTIVVRPPSVGTITNTATVSSNTPDPNSRNGSASAQTTVAPAADLSLTKTDSPDPVHIGQQLTYTITVTNRGPNDATGVTLVDQLPKNAGFGSVTTSQGTCSLKPDKRTVTCNLGSVPNGATATVKIMVKPSQKGTLTNTASVKAASPDDIVPGNNAATATTQVIS